MKNVAVEDFVKQEKRELIIACKDMSKKGKPCVRIDFKAQFLNLPSHISLQRQEVLKAISRENTKTFARELIDAELEGRFITGFYRGNNLLLPPRFRHFYEQCVEVETEGLDIYFTDFAILKFQDTIGKLERRSLDDGYHFVTKKLAQGKVINLSLGIFDSSSFRRGRSVRYEGGDSLLDSPRYTAYYHTDENEDGTIHPEEIANMEDIISLFAQQNGGFSSMRWNDKECVAYNRGSIYVTGIDKAPQLKEKIYRYMKRNNEMFTLPTSGEEK